ncbi:MAG: 2-amino-4-hydroxy-6-hydroxymethyldihydropteridine diphosphokinase, partial [Psychrobacter sp.]|nr:2-amino-4-hydroxy-6-hydroxymethyldihydropteridine diphosphokinase [Psychrobacter sp.]
MDIPSLPLSQIGHRSPAVLAHHKIKAALLAIGSNYQAEYYLAKVAEQLTALGEMQVSTPLQNPDFTATVEQPKPDYVNQCLLLSLHAPMNLSALQKVLKGFEAKCDRHRDNESNSSCKLEGGGNQALSEKGGGYHSSRVTMDIDILMVQLGQDLA